MGEVCVFAYGYLKSFVLQLDGEDNKLLTCPTVQLFELDFRLLFQLFIFGDLLLFFYQLFVLELQSFVFVQLLLLLLPGIGVLLRVTPLNFRARGGFDVTLLTYLVQFIYALLFCRTSLVGLFDYIGGVDVLISSVDCLFG